MIGFNLFERYMKKGLGIILLDEELNDDKEFQRRWNICQSNVCGVYDEKKDKCRSCGCYMEIKANMKKHINIKALGRVEITHCPLAYWGEGLGEEERKQELEITNYYRKLDGKESIK